MKQHAITSLVGAALVGLLAAVGGVSQAADSLGEPGRSAGKKNPLKNVYFGEQHMHTSSSFDAFTVGVTMSWDDAYRFAKGEKIKLSTTGEPMQRRTPYDVVWSDADKRKVEACGTEARPICSDLDRPVPPVGNTVNINKATYTNSIGDTQLSAVWTDPDFDPTHHAVYYARVLEIPTPRWTTYDAAKLGIDPPKDVAPTLQERAWSSPIWYTPSEDLIKRPETYFGLQSFLP